MTTEHTYEALQFEFSHNATTLKQTTSIINDPLPEHGLMGQELFQALYQAGIPWAKLVRPGEVEAVPGDIDANAVAENPQDWFVDFDVTGLEATYAVRGVQTYEPYAVQLELVRWSTK